MSTPKALLLSGAAIAAFGLLSLLALGVTGYFIDLPDADNLDQRRLESNKSTWESLRQQNYNYVHIPPCNDCLHVEVVVRNDRVVESDELTVGDLFDHIQHAIDNDADILHVEYSHKYGVPMEIFISFFIFPIVLSQAPYR